MLNISSRSGLKVSATLSLALAAALSLGQSKDPGQISGLFFGDYYNVSQHHNKDIQGMNGFWFRRIYLTYDKKLDEGFSVRLRLEAGSPGDFTSTTTLQPFFKDAYLAHTQNGHTIAFGLIPTPTWEAVENTLGYRPIEKSPLDLYKMGEARDQGVSFRGALSGDKKTSYWLMVGNGSGTKGKSTKGLATYLLLSHKVTDEVTLDAYADQWDKPGHTDWRTLQANLMYSGKTSRAGLLFAEQRRQNTSGPDTKVRVTSLYVDTQASETARPFIRVDFLSDKVPGADKINYLALSPDAIPTFYVAGVEFKLSQDVKVIPNIEYVTYRDSSLTSGPKNNVFFRITVACSFK